MNADKRRKLFDLEAMRRRLPHVSQRGLCATLRDIRKHGLPDLDHRDDLRAARDLMVNQRTPYGPIGIDKDIPTAGGGSIKVRMASPLALLCFAFLHCAPFAEFMEHRLIEHPSTVDTPWNAILYCDEVHPGDQLGGKKLRKFHAIYLSFKEFGIAGLSNENLWFTIATVRTQVVNQIPGAMSNVFSVILRDMFVDGPLADLGLLLESVNGRRHRFLQSLVISSKMEQHTNRPGIARAMLVASFVCFVVTSSVKPQKLPGKMEKCCFAATPKNTASLTLQHQTISDMLLCV